MVKNKLRTDTGSGQARDRTPRTDPKDANQQNPSHSRRGIATPPWCESQRNYEDDLAAWICVAFVAGAPIQAIVLLFSMKYTDDSQSGLLYLRRQSGVEEVRSARRQWWRYLRAGRILSWVIRDGGQSLYWSVTVAGNGQLPGYWNTPRVPTIRLEERATTTDFWPNGAVRTAEVLFPNTGLMHFEQDDISRRPFIKIQRNIVQNVMHADEYVGWW